jgi:hypothetical protein
VFDVSANTAVDIITVNVYWFGQPINHIILGGVLQEAEGDVPWSVKQFLCMEHIAGIRKQCLITDKVVKLTVFLRWLKASTFTHSGQLLVLVCDLKPICPWLGEFWLDARLEFELRKLAKGLIRTGRSFWAKASMAGGSGSCPCSVIPWNMP